MYFRSLEGEDGREIDETTFNTPTVVLSSGNLKEAKSNSVVSVRYLLAVLTRTTVMTPGRCPRVRRPFLVFF